MAKFVFINSPFTEHEFPSIELTQLNPVTESTFRDKVEVENHYFASIIGQDFYHNISCRGDSNKVDLVMAL